MQPTGTVKEFSVLRSDLRWLKLSDILLVLRLVLVVESSSGKYPSRPRGEDKSEEVKDRSNLR
jgi:hypothetical protein